MLPVNSGNLEICANVELGERSSIGIVIGCGVWSFIIVLLVCINVYAYGRATRDISLSLTKLVKDTKVYPGQGSETN